MAMYAQLLGAALERYRSGGERSTGEVLAELLAIRIQLAQLDEFLSGEAEPDWVPAALADQLSHDVTLIELAQRHGIDSDPMAFDPPQPERARLERVLLTRGIPLAWQDAQGQPFPELPEDPSSGPG